MAAWKAALLNEASRRFQDQQKYNTDADASCTQYMAPISPTPPGLIDGALMKLAGEVNRETGFPLLSPGATVIDLGCGDGRWLISTAQFFQSRSCPVNCVGCDLDDALLAKARAAAAAIRTEGAAQKSSITFLRQDLMAADVSGATVVIAYLFREGCDVVMGKLERELEPTGTAVISVGFELRGWRKAQWTLRVNGSVPCYFYAPPWRANQQPETGEEAEEAEPGAR